MTSIHDKAMMENLYWWGVPTLFRCPHIDTSGSDIALVGVPHSTGNGTTERDQHLGPRAVRDISAIRRRVHLNFGIDPWSLAKIVDAGDVPLPRANDNEACIEDIRNYFARLDAQLVRPVSVGGDHSITGGILSALGRGQVAGGKPISLLHFDAHTDVFTKVDHFLGATKSAAHWGAYLADEKKVDPSKSIQIGLRGHPRTLDWLQPAYDYGYNIITMQDFRERALKSVQEQIRAVLGDNPVYITFDLDCLDPTIAPGVANIEPGEKGFDIDEAVSLLRMARGLNVIGGDVVCLMPTKDAPNKITAHTASSVMFEIIAIMAENVEKQSLLDV